VSGSATLRSNLRRDLSHDRGAPLWPPGSMRMSTSAKRSVLHRYSAPTIRLARRLDKSEIEFLVMTFLVMTGWICFALRAVLALAGIGR
jgi:hypothetical protein